MATVPISVALAQYSQTMTGNVRTGTAFHSSQLTWDSSAPCYLFPFTWCKVQQDMSEAKPDRRTDMQLIDPACCRLLLVPFLSIRMYFCSNRRMCDFTTTDFQISDLQKQWRSIDDSRTLYCTKLNTAYRISLRKGYKPNGFGKPNRLKTFG